MRRRPTPPVPPMLLALLLLLALALPAGAAAHVTVVPRQAPAGAYAVFDVRVPNERDDAATIAVELRLPDGFVAAAYEPVPGWRTRVVRERLARPIETPYGPISEQVGRIVWSGDGSPAGSIPPGAFRDFPLSVQVPDEPGATLAFKALQTYDDGEIVRWIGDPDSDLPAATVAVGSAAGEGDGAGAGHGGEPDATGADARDATPSAGSASGGDGDGSGLAIAALVVGALGALLGGAALIRGPRHRNDRELDSGHAPR
jgi:periplasmic copper chaperone A